MEEPSAGTLPGVGALTSTLDETLGEIISGLSSAGLFEVDSLETFIPTAFASVGLSLEDISTTAAALEISGFSSGSLLERAVMAATGKAGGTTVGDDSRSVGTGSFSSLFGGRTIRASSVIFALRRKIPNGSSGATTGDCAAGVASASFSASAVGFRINGDSFSREVLGVDDAGGADGESDSAFVASGDSTSAREVDEGSTMGSTDAGGGDDGVGKEGAGVVEDSTGGLKTGGAEG